MLVPHACTAYTNDMNMLSLLILLVVFAVIIFIVRSIVRVIRRTPKGRFPVLSIVLLGTSCILCIASVVIILFVNSELGGAVGGLGSFFGLLESKIRHDREARQAEVLNDKT